ncbi:MAG: dTDP-4-dehydrorhamnose reductase [Acidimicrobiia bacterium]
MSPVVLGSRGQLGTAFAKLLGERVRALTKAELDVTDGASVRQFFEDSKPDIVINCTGYTAVDRAEAEVADARALNVSAVRHIAREAARSGSGLITFSTDYVFDGTKATGYVETDDPNPLSVYGLTKLEGERAALSEMPRALVVRTSWLLSATHPNFASAVLHRARSGYTEVVTDQKGRPTFVDDLANAALKASQNGVTGLLHLANQGVTTWYDLAREVVSLAGLDSDLIQPILSSDLQRPAQRPANSVLDSVRITEPGVSQMGDYSESLPFLVELIANGG